jgi:hypothetical protein
LEALYAVRGAENIFDHAFLCAIQLRVPIGNLDCFPTCDHGRKMVLPFAHATNNFLFGFDSPGGGEMTARNGLRPVDGLKFTGSHAGREIHAYLAVSDLAHAAAQRITDDCPFIDNGLPFKVLVAGECDSLANPLERIEFQDRLLRPLPRSADHRTLTSLAVSPTSHSGTLVLN